jgi:glycosyltransferase involved in cell wall biosynthesis
VNQQRKLVISGLTLANPNVGQGVYTSRLLVGLSKRSNVDFVVVAPKDIPKPPELLERQFVRLPDFRAPGNALIRHIFASHHLLRFVRSHFPNCIFHSPGPICGLTRPRRTVVTLHDCLYRHFPNYNGRFFVRQILMRAAERFAAGAALILTGSEYSRQDLIKNANIPSCKIQILHPWVGNEFLVPSTPAAVTALRAKFGLPKRFWLYLGGYDYRKNIEFLLNAYAEAARDIKLPPLVLAGKIPTKTNPATCDVPGALMRVRPPKDSILLPGTISSGDLPTLYRAAALLIYPSLIEGFGLPVAEAMATGTPVLASNTSSLPEVVCARHCLFDPRDKGALMSKLANAAREEAQFTSELPPTFSENHGITRYLELLNKLKN